MQKQFKTTTELLTDSVFVQKVENSIEELRVQRSKRPEPKPGMRYARNWYDRMRDEGVLNTSFFIENIEAIWVKKSNLSSEYRRIILAVCTNAIEETIIEYSKRESLGNSTSTDK